MCLKTIRETPLMQKKITQPVALIEGKNSRYGKRDFEKSQIVEKRYKNPILTFLRVITFVLKKLSIVDYSGQITWEINFESNAPSPTFWQQTVGKSKQRLEDYAGLQISRIFLFIPLKIERVVSIHLRNWQKMKKKLIAS